MTNEEQNFRRWVTKVFTGKDIPILTEDERVILRNIDKKYKKISRENDTIYLVNGTRPYVFDCNFDYFNNLFQFIQERRRIRDSRTIERRIKMEQIVIGIIIGTICGLVGSALGIKKAKKDIEKEEKVRTEKNIV